MSQKRKLFGTDGIRGTANKEPMTAEIALRVGQAAGVHFVRGAHRHRVVIGKDTRLSGYLLEPAITAGFVAAGMDPILVGPMPTPAVAMLTKSLRADLGVMISASHNPYEDNGIKLFGPDGCKLSDEEEAAIERFMEEDLSGRLADSENLGRAKRLDDAQGRYIEFAKRTFPSRLDGLKIVIDCAHGAAYKVAPTVLWELGAEVIKLGVDPNGFNINAACGSTHPESMQERVRTTHADLGIALDGDADRVIIADENGKLIDGDQIMATIAEAWSRNKKLSNGHVVATVMSNLGLERFITSLGLTLARTPVGDRYVFERMRELGSNVGGEQSGHIILTDYATTGDGLIAALQLLAVMVETNKRASEICRRFTPVPQVIKNVRFNGVSPLEKESFRKEMLEVETSLLGKGRLVIRNSGTEPVLRIMIEGEDESLIANAVDYLGKFALSV